MAKLSSTNVFGDLYVDGKIVGEIDGAVSATEYTDTSDVSINADFTPQINTLSTQMNALSTQMGALSTQTGALSNLQTTAKGSLVAAINEVFQAGSNAKQELVDALTSKGVTCSTSDSWETLIGHVSSFSAGGGVSGAKIFAATALPKTGSTNQICIVTNPLPNKIHIGRIKPTSFSTNDIWIDLDGNNNGSSLLTFEMGDLSTNVRVRTCYKLTSSSSQTEVLGYYWNGSKWIACAPTLVNVTYPTGTSGSINLGSTSATWIDGSVSRSIVFNGYEGFEYTGTCMIKVYHSFEIGSSDASYKYTVTAYNAAGTQTYTKSSTTTLGDEDYFYFRNIPIVPGGKVTVTATVASGCEHSLYIYAYANKA